MTTQYVQAWECIGTAFSGFVYTQAIALDKHPSKPYRESEYNGWTTRATWNANLWLSNDEGLYRATRYIVASATRADRSPAVEVETFCREIWGSQTPDNCNLDEVNWNEVAGAFIDE